MRMDTDANFTAKDLVNTYSEDELCRVLRDYGEERYARQIARNIVRWREKKLIETTGELEAIVKASLPEKILKTKGHPCRTVFQAIRIEVNGELDGLEGAVESAVDILNTDGRIPTCAASMGTCAQTRDHDTHEPSTEIITETMTNQYAQLPETSPNR